MIPRIPTSKKNLTRLDTTDGADENRLKIGIIQDLFPSPLLSIKISDDIPHEDDADEETGGKQHAERLDDGSDERPRLGDVPEIEDLPEEKEDDAGEEELV